MPVTRLRSLADRGHGMSDAMLVRKSNLYEKFRLAASKAEAKKRAVGKEVIAELNARGTRMIERTGIRVTETKQYRTEYDFWGLAEELDPELVSQIRPDVVDPGKLSRLVQDGRIPLEVVDRHSTRRLHANYPSVSYPKD